MTDHPAAFARLPQETPHWLRDIDATLPVTGQYVVHGNLRDVHLIPADEDFPPRFVSTFNALWWMLRRNGFDFLLHFDPVTGLQVVPDPDAEISTRSSAAAAQVLTGLTAQLGRTASHEAMSEVLQAVAQHPQLRGALILDYVSQLRVDDQPYPDDLRRLMLSSLVEVHRGRGFAHPQAARPGMIHNARFWFVDRSPDLPSWLVGGSDGIRQVPLSLPDLDTRLAAARLLEPLLPRDPGLPEARAQDEQDQDRQGRPDGAVARFARSSEGMTLRAMRESVLLAADQGITAARVEDSVRAYRLGLTENVWQRPALHKAIRKAQSVLGNAVLGQERAVRHVADILIRSTLGMTSAHLGSRSNGPRGVLFFAGPTGVGKTELAKQMTELLFGDERAYIRFDMSEFSAEHTEARLVGSPPGYTGFGSGGELTNAVRQRPFSVVLFDEIEKAHPLILDKFLQILSDGRLTDGMGATVHFSETIIVFTSNLGVSESAAQLAADPAASYAGVMLKVIKEHFTDQHRINRPELLGRIGDNIVVFDPLRPDVAITLAHRFIANVVARVAAERSIALVIDPRAHDALVAAVTRDTSTGGRGIGMQVESLLVNPLARVLLDRAPGTLRITGFSVVDGDGILEVT